MKKGINAAKLAGAMALAGSSSGCADEVIAPQTYNLDFEQTAIKCGQIEDSTPYDKTRYCSGMSDTDEVIIDSFYDTTDTTRAKIHAAVSCVYAPLENVRFEIQSAMTKPVLVHFGGFALPGKIAKGTYDEGNSNSLIDHVYIADRYQEEDGDSTTFFTAKKLGYVAIHEIGHTLGLLHSDEASIMYESVLNSYPFYFTVEHAQQLLENTGSDVTEEKMEQLTLAEDRCKAELKALEEPIEN